MKLFGKKQNQDLPCPPSDRDMVLKAIQILNTAGAVYSVVFEGFRFESSLAVQVERFSISEIDELRKAYKQASESQTK